MRVTIISTNRERFPLLAIPNGPAMVAAALIKRGHEVQILDLLFSNDYKKTIKEHVDQFDPEIIGISIRETDNNELFGFRSYLEGIKQITEFVRKKSRAKIIAGGSAFTLFPSQLLDYLGLEYGISGDGEISLPLFIQYMQGDVEFQAIPGICYKNKGNTIINTTARISSLDSLPFPAYELLDLKSYMSSAPGLTIQGKRGCAMACSFCPDGADKVGCRTRSADSIADEMQHMIGRHGIKRFYFTDSIFNYPPEHALAVCNEIIKRKLDVGWMAGINPVGITPDIVSAMHLAGCRYLSLGIDTASEKMLDNYNKGFKKADIVSTANLLSEAKIRFDYSLLIGGPGENLETVQESLDFISKVTEQVSIRAGIRIFPGTVLEKQAVVDGCITANQNLMEPVFYLSKELPFEIMNWLDRQCESHSNWLTITKMIGQNPSG
jgi:radical SAM superfamily enzyme YgiQ (UPF0313 family)